MKCFLIILDGSRYRPMYEHMFSEGKDRNDVYLIVDKKENKRLKKLLIRRKVQDITRGSFDFIYLEKNSLYNWLSINSKEYKKIYIVFTNASLNYNPYICGNLQRYQKKWPSIKYILYYLDIVGCGPSRNADFLRKKGIFDLIYSIDAKDCERYGLLHTYTVYPSNTFSNKSRDLYDLYFAGVSKNRSGIIKELVENNSINNADSRIKIDLICGGDSEILQGYEDRINLYPKNNYLDYNYILEEELSSNVILDIVQPGQKALSLRPYEAVVYNKKLLTNNKSIFSFPYYNEKYMKYFEDTSGISWEWINRRETVDYGYKGDFSLNTFLDDIDRRL